MKTFQDWYHENDLPFIFNSMIGNEVTITPKVGTPRKIIIQGIYRGWVYSTVAGQPFEKLEGYVGFIDSKGETIGFENLEKIEFNSEEFVKYKG